MELLVLTMKCVSVCGRSLIQTRYKGNTSI